MADQSTHEAQVFEESVKTLFYFGQFPVVLLSVGALVALGLTYQTEDTWRLFSPVAFAIASIVLTELAVTNRKKERLSLLLLFLSLIATIAYLHFLVRFTNGSGSNGAGSPFQNLYLYMPVVVFMVTQRNRWADWVSAGAVLVSFMANYGISDRWRTWTLFASHQYFYIFEFALVAILLILLGLVNRKMETIKTKGGQGDPLEARGKQ